MTTVPIPREPTEELIRAAREGDVRAWEALDKRYRVALSLFLRRKIPPKLRPRFDTEDLLQSAFLCAFSELNRYEYRGEGSFLSWMITILSNRLTSRLRRAANKLPAKSLEETHDSKLELALHGTDGQETPSEIHAQAEEAARLIQAIADLPDDLRDVVVQVHLDQKSQLQVARERGEAPDTVRRKLAKGIEFIRRSLGEKTH